MTSKIVVDIKRASAKYLGGNWTRSEQQRLIELRREVVSDLVEWGLPYFLGHPEYGSSSAKQSAIDEHVQNVLTILESGQGIDAAKDYFIESLNAKPEIGAGAAVGGIEDLAKLHYIGEKYFGDSDGPYYMSSYDGLGRHTDNMTVKWKDGKVTVRNRSNVLYGRGELLELVPEPRTIVASFVGPRPGHPFFQSTPRTVTPEQSLEEIEEAARRSYKQIIGEKYTPLLSERITVPFDEGIATQSSVVFHKYTPRVGTMMDKLLT